MTTIPSKDENLVYWAFCICANCTTNQTIWKLSKDFIDTFTALVSRARSARAADADPLKSNHATKIARIQATLALREYMRLVVHVLVANDLVTDTDLGSMNLPPRFHPAYNPLPVPTGAPDLRVVIGLHHNVDLYASLPRLGQATRYLKKHGTAGILVRYRLDDSPDWTDCYSTRLHHTLRFDSSHVGRRLTLTVAWVNPRLQPGPWSPEHTLIIN
jgi:hypothetical protein